jgi:predicted TIM-barrel fold metal-dependent hydrolase
MQQVYVDSHLHVFEANQAIAGARYVPSYFASLDAWVKQAGLVGITHGVLVQPSFLGTNNGLMLHHLKTNPNTLRGVAVISPDASREQLQVLHDSGVRAIRLNLAGQPQSFARWSDSQRLWDQIIALGWHLEIHTDQAALPTVIKQLPIEIPLVVDHMAKPQKASSGDPTFKALRQRSVHSKVHVKLSGPYRLGSVSAAHVVPILLDSMGAGCLLWGSDWPFTNFEEKANYAELFAQIHDWLSLDNLTFALSKNPLEVYWRV